MYAIIRTHQSNGYQDLCKSLFTSHGNAERSARALTSNQGAQHGYSYHVVRVENATAND